MSNTSNDLPAEIKKEIGLIAWKDLAHFFAQGSAVAIHTELDLAEVALQFTHNNTAAVSTWMREGKVAKVSDEQARAWFDADQAVRAIVISPWVLVQEIEAT